MIIPPYSYTTFQLLILSFSLGGGGSPPSFLLASFFQQILPPLNHCPTSFNTLLPKPFLGVAELIPNPSPSTLPQSHIIITYSPERYLIEFKPFPFTHVLLSVTCDDCQRSKSIKVILTHEFELTPLSNT